MTWPYARRRWNRVPDAWQPSPESRRRNVGDGARRRAGAVRRCTWRRIGRSARPTRRSVRGNDAHLEPGANRSSGRPWCQTVTAASYTTTSTATTATDNGRRAVVTDSTVPVASAPPQDPDAPAVVARPVPVDPPPPPPAAPPPPWAASRDRHARRSYLDRRRVCRRCDGSGHSTRSSPAASGQCSAGTTSTCTTSVEGDTCGCSRTPSSTTRGTASTLDRASFVHNAALLQEGRCFRLLHARNAERPQPFEPGTGTATLDRWFWPMGGEVHGGVLRVFWAEMVKDPIDPTPPDGLGWHPVRTHVAAYDPATMARLDFRPATEPGRVADLRLRRRQR